MQREVTILRQSSFSSMSVGMSIMESILRIANVVHEAVVLFSKILCITFVAIVKNILPKSKKDLSGEIVLITGSAHGVGKQLAIDIAKLGSKVILWDINEKNLKEVAEEIKRNGGQAWWYVCDVTSEEDVNEKAETVAKDVGDVTILINNAGIMQNVPVMELDSKKIKKTFEVNVIAHFWTIRAFLPKMQQKNRGHIVAISSAAGLIGHVNQSDYSASKYAVVGMMESLSEEMRLSNYDIRFTTICPLTVNTGMNHHPVSRYPFITPILTVEEAVHQILEAIQTEEFLVSLPRSSSSFLILLKLLPRKVTSDVMDVLEYCRISNDVPTENEMNGKAS